MGSGLCGWDRFAASQLFTSRVTTCEIATAKTFSMVAMALLDTYWISNGLGSIFYKKNGWGALRPSFVDLFERSLYSNVMWTRGPAGVSVTVRRTRRL